MEGRTELIVPRLDSYGSGKEFLPSKAPVFFNPRMEFCRSVSVCALAGMGKGLSVCDALAASGARGLRYGNEVGNKVTFFDYNPQAVALIRRNIKNLGLEAEVEKGDANALLSQGMWDVVDLDPFGTPVPFLDACARRTKKWVMATATDTAVLCGAYPKACLRIYGAIPFNGEFCHEAGLRILAGKIVREFAKYEKALSLVLSQSSDHYLRVFGKVERGAKRADKVLEEMGWILHCPKCGSREVRKGLVVEGVRCKCRGKYQLYGPLWAGDLFEVGFCKKARKFGKEYGQRVQKYGKGYDKRVQKFFDMVVAEAGAPYLYCDVHKAASVAGKSAPPMEKLVEALEKKGFVGVGSHMTKDPVLRTDCGFPGLVKIIKSIS